MSRVQSASHAGPCTCVTSVEPRTSSSSRLRQLCQKGGAAHTINPLQELPQERRGEAEVNGVKWRALIEQKASRGKLWAAFGVEQFLRRMFHHQKKWARSILEDAENVKRPRTDGKWQYETPYMEEFELLRHITDLRFEGSLLRQACNAAFLGHGKHQRKIKRESESMLQ